jgi:branched-chain amino acid transport system substrate-binding protein
VLLCAVAAALAGCGGGGGGGGERASVRGVPRTLTVYSDLAVDGPTGPTGPTGERAAAAQQLSIQNGARLALERWHHTVRYGRRGHRGSFHIAFDAMSDADPASGLWSAGVTAANAQKAAAQPNAVAYIGDFSSAATALSLPTLSPAGIIQVSPWSPYVGFTDANPADDQGDPARYYPSSGRNDFARLVPSDLVEARATVEFMRSEGVSRLFVLGDVSVFDAAIAQLVANDAPAAAITLVGLQQGIDTQTNDQPRGYAAIAAAVAASRADAVLLGGAPGVGAVALWRELHALVPHARLFAPSTLATPRFLQGIAAPGSGCTNASGAPIACGDAASATYLTSPILELRQYPPAARTVLGAYRRRFGAAASPYALYGYEAMADVLKAIRLTGRQVANRAVLLRVFFHRLGIIRGVIGDYTIDGRGDSSLATFDGYRVGADGALRLVREIRAG